MIASIDITTSPLSNPFDGLAGECSLMKFVAWSMDIYRSPHYSQFQYCVHGVVLENLLVWSGSTSLHRSVGSRGIRGSVSTVGSSEPKFVGRGSESSRCHASGRATPILFSGHRLRDTSYVQKRYVWQCRGNQLSRLGRRRTTLAGAPNGYCRS